LNRRLVAIAEPSPCARERLLFYVKQPLARCIGAMERSTTAPHATRPLSVLRLAIDEVETRQWVGKEHSIVDS
jgi:hypothetical protein